EPIVRNSVVAYLSSLAFNELRSMQIGELQQRLEVVLFEDFASKNAVVPFKHVLVNKLLVQYRPRQGSPLPQRSLPRRPSGPLGVRAAGGAALADAVPAARHAARPAPAVADRPGTRR